MHSLMADDKSRDPSPRIAFSPCAVPLPPRPLTNLPHASGWIHVNLAPLTGKIPDFGPDPTHNDDHRESVISWVNTLFHKYTRLLTPALEFPYPPTLPSLPGLTKMPCTIVTQIHEIPLLIGLPIKLPDSTQSILNISRRQWPFSHRNNRIPRARPRASWTGTAPLPAGPSVRRRAPSDIAGAPRAFGW